MDVMVGIPLWHISGLVKITLLIRRVHLIWLMVMTTELDALHKLNVKIALQIRDVGLRKEPKSILSVNMEPYRNNKI